MNLLANFILFLEYPYYNFEPDYADSMFNFNLSVKIYRSIVHCKMYI